MSDTIGFCQETRPDDCAFVLFGATGDLAGRKVIPALFGLCAKGLAPRGFHILLVARTPLGRPALETRLRELLSRTVPGATAAALAAFLGRVEYLPADYESPAFYRALSSRLDELDAKHGIRKKRLFYLAIPPSAFGAVTARLKDSGLLADPADRTGWSRLIIEKPYGSSFERACAVDAELKKGAAEDQIYRIDHFTGKETVQNVLALRAANAVFDGTWNARFIDHVQLTVFETLGVEGRADFFESIGLARDMMSHVLQLAAITAMDLPASFREADFKTEKRRFFESVAVPDKAAAARAVRAQYEGYLLEPGVAPASAVETFFAFKFFVNSGRWRGVPFYVRAGKKTGTKLTRISLVYKKPERGIFSGMEIGYPNVFTFNIQPEEDITFSLIAKHPGPKLCFVPKTMRLTYREHAEENAAPTDYERLLIEAMAGDQTLFLSVFEMQFLWKFLSPLLRAWEEDPAGASLCRYQPGTDGPARAADLIEKDGRAWV